MNRVFLRTACALLLVSGWIAAFFSGWLLGGLIHLLPVLALVLFPWRHRPRPLDAGEDSG